MMIKKKYFVEIVKIGKHFFQTLTQLINKSVIKNEISDILNFVATNMIQITWETKLSTMVRSQVRFE